MKLYNFNLRLFSSRTRIVRASRNVGKTIDSLPMERRSAIVNALSAITKCLSKIKRACITSKENDKKLMNNN